MFARRAHQQDATQLKADFERACNQTEANQTPAALRAIGARQMAAIVEQANALFPGGAPPVDRSERQCVLDEIDPDSHIFNQLDRRFYAYPDEISTLVYDFVVAHRDQIRGA